ncbi:MAG: cytochrome c [Bacteroidota bacterium]
MKNFIKITYFLVLVIVFTSCNESNTKRKVQYMSDTDMYDAVPYETYSKNPVFKNGISAQLPVEGTIARGDVVYDYPDNEAGYQMAKDSLKSPIQISDKNLARGKEMYTIFCAICHGDTGDGQGTLVINEKFLGVPNYKDREITEGSTYHVIMYGRNLMGSHASQLTNTERWQVVQYVESLRAELLK